MTILNRKFFQWVGAPVVLAASFALACETSETPDDDGLGGSGGTTDGTGGSNDGTGGSSDGGAGGETGQARWIAANWTA
ncbi:MAG TPA: hypothetical protein VLC09_03305, partial [Polyangiaceae bacterium]|nr:hypothetical protein [Polyangiaceae bacterium]